MPKLPSWGSCMRKRVPFSKKKFQVMARSVLQVSWSGVGSDKGWGLRRAEVWGCPTDNTQSCRPHTPPMSCTSKGRSFSSQFQFCFFPLWLFGCFYITKAYKWCKYHPCWVLILLMPIHLLWNGFIYCRTFKRVSEIVFWFYWRGKSLCPQTSHLDPYGKQ